MKKIVITDFFTGKITIVSLSDEIIKDYDNDVESILIENSTSYIQTCCEWFDAPLDEFGNIEIRHELINERKS